MRPLPPATPAHSVDHHHHHASGALVDGKPLPIGIPPLFIADALSRGRSADEVLHGARGLIAEYTGAAGYAYGWGHIIEIRHGRYVLWRFVPVGMWEALAPYRVGSPLLIEELISLAEPAVRRSLRRLPHDVLLVGRQGARRRSRHALFSLLLADPDIETAVRQWLATDFLLGRLPHWLRTVEQHVGEILRA